MKKTKWILATLALVFLVWSCKKDQPQDCTDLIIQADYWQYRADTLYDRMGDSAYQVLKAKEPQRNFVDHWRYLAAKYRGEYLACKY